jgi:quercetin dioxygenase-like cupin family protein
MDEQSFEAALRRDGFSEVVRRAVPPDQGLPEHSHDWEVRGLVLSGHFRVHGAAGVQDCGPGEVFTLPAAEPHTEAAGAEGAELLIGRKYQG